MSDLDDMSRGQFLGFAGRAAVSTLVASSIGVNLGLMTVAAAKSGKETVDPSSAAPSLGP